MLSFNVSKVALLTLNVSKATLLTIERVRMHMVSGEAQ